MPDIVEHSHNRCIVPVFIAGFSVGVLLPSGFPSLDVGLALKLQFVSPVASKTLSISPRCVNFHPFVPLTGVISIPRNSITEPSIVISQLNSSPSSSKDFNKLSMSFGSLAKMQQSSMYSTSSTVGLMNRHWSIGCIGPNHVKASERYMSESPTQTPSLFDIGEWHNLDFKSRAACEDVYSSTKR